MALLEIRDVTVQFGGLTALNRVGFAVEEGEIVGLIGPNGAGKTTCFNVVSGFVPPTGGQVTFEKETVSLLRPEQIARRGIVRTFQKESLFFGLTVVENIMIGQRARLRPTLVGALLNRDQAGMGARRDEALRVLDFLGMSKLRDTGAGELAYGDQRRLAIAIALAAGPRVLMLDEPAAGMNARESKELGELIGRIQASGTTVVLVEHDVRMVMTVCNRVIVLDAGRMLAEGDPESIRRNPEVVRVYLGETYARERDRANA